MGSKVKIMKWIKQHRALFWSWGIALILYTIIYTCYGIFPFGNQSVARYDGFFQVNMMYEHVLGWLTGEHALTFSAGTAGGLDVVGTLLYMCASPLGVLYLIGGRGNVHYIVSFVYVIKTLLMMSTLYLMIKTIYPKVSNKMIVCLLLLYSFSGSFIANQSFAVWVDLFIYFPLFVLGYDRLMKGKGIALFVVILLLMIISTPNLMISCAVVIVTLTFVYPLITKQDSKTIKDLVVAYVLAVILALPFLTTFAATMFSSNRLQETNSWLIFSNDHLIVKMSFLLFDTILLSICSIGLFQKEKSPQLKFWTIALIMCLLPILIDQLQVLLCFGKYYGYASRLAVMYPIVAVSMICQMCAEKVQFTLPDKTKGAYSNLYFFSVLYGVLAIGFIPIMQQLSSVLALSQSSKVTLMFLAIIMFPTILIILSVNKGMFLGKISKRLMCFVSVILIMITLVLSGTSIGACVIRLDTNQQLEYLMEEYQLSGQRVKLDIGRHETANYSLNLSFHNFNCFTSVLGKENMRLAKVLGYDTNLTNVIRPYGGTLLSDMIFGYSYVVTEYPTQYPYYTLMGQYQDLYLYRNTLSLENGFGVDTLFLYDESWDVITTQQHLYEWLGGEGQLFETIELTSLLPDNCYEGEELQLSGLLQLETFVIPVKDNRYYYLTTNQNTTLIDEIDVDSIKKVNNSEYIIELGYAKENGEMSLQWVIDSSITQEDVVDLKMDIVSINIDLLSQLYNKLSQECILQYHDTTIAYSFGKEYNYYVLPVVAQAGWGATEQHDLGMITVTQQEGHLTYQSPYRKIFWIMMLVSIVVAISWLLLYRFGYLDWIERLDKWFYWMIGSVAALVVATGIVLQWLTIIV